MGQWPVHVAEIHVTWDILTWLGHILPSWAKSSIFAWVNIC